MKKIIKVSKFNLSDIVADYEEIVSTRYSPTLKCEIKAGLFRILWVLCILQIFMSHVKTAASELRVRFGDKVCLATLDHLSDIVVVVQYYREKVGLSLL